MNRINQLFENKKSKSEKSLILYLTAGYPSLGITEELLCNLPDWGCDLIELGVPFSDPIADGPTIQYSSTSSLNSGTTLKKIIEMLPAVRKKTEVPIVIFSALNPILKYGLEAFVNDAASAGVDGVLIPDLPPEEGKELSNLCAQHGLTITFLLAPTSSKERMQIVADQSSGFIYYISLRGVTGARAELARDLDEKVGEIRSVTDKPVAVGFGVSKPEHAKRIAQVADGIVVGSTLIDKIRTTFEKENKSGDDAMSSIKDFVQSLATAIK